MRIRITGALIAVALQIAFVASVMAQVDSITYQGHLTDGGTPANGLYDFSFELFTDPSAGSSWAAATNTAVVVTNGLFTVQIEVGPDVFDGTDLWLEIGAVTNGGGAFTTLSSRQPITSAPYAMYAGSADAEGLMGTISPNNIGAGSITSVMLANGSVGTDQLASGAVFTGSFVGDGGSISNLNSASLTGALRVDPPLASVGHNPTGGNAQRVAVSGNYAYLASGGGGIEVCDISDPNNPTILKAVNEGSDAVDVTVSGHILYLANYTDGLLVYDISNPVNPVNIGQINDGGDAFGVAVSGNYAYLANGADGLRIYDISDPANPISVGHIDDSPGYARFVVLSGHIAFVACEADGLRIYDVSNPANPIGLGHVDDGGSAYDVAVSGSYAYLANNDDGLRVYNVSDPANPINVGHIDDGGAARGVVARGGYVYLANADDGLRLYDVGNPANPINFGHYDDGGDAFGLAVAGSYVYLANNADGLRVYALGSVRAPVFAGDFPGSANLTGTFAGDGGSLRNLNSASLTGPLTVDPGSLLNIGHFFEGGYAHGVAISGNYVYLANRADGLRVYDISDPISVTNIGHAFDAGIAQSVAVSGSHAYVANSSDGLRVYNISDPFNPASVGHVDDGGFAYDVVVMGNYVYLCDSSDGLRVYDVSDPTAPFSIDLVSDGGSANSIAVSGGYAYLANDTDGLRVYDIGDPTNTFSIGHIDNGGTATGIAVSGNYAYLANWTDGLRIYDISDPANPVNVGHVNDSSSALGVTVSGDYVYLAEFGDGLRIYNVSDPTSPVEIGHANDGGGAIDVAVWGKHAYLANANDGMRVYALGAASASVFNGNFAGNGSALNELDAGALSVGTLSSERFSGSYSNALAMNNISNSFSGAFTGDGTSITNVDAASLSGLDASDFWQLGGNSGAPGFGKWLGTTDNYPLVFRVNGMTTLQFVYPSQGFQTPYSPNIIGGWASSINNSTEGAVIVGGGQTYSPNTIGAFCNFSVIGGGLGNNIKDNTTYGVVAGGNFNEIWQSSHLSTISGGWGNTIQSNSLYSTIVGGLANEIGHHSFYSTIVGGNQNVVGNEVDNAFAAGNRAIANHSGAFVWGDSTDADFASTGDDQFLIRATGGVGIGKNNPATALDVNGTVTATAFSGNGSALTGLPDGHSLDADDGNPTDAVYVDSAGEVGIGTSSPDDLLHVFGGSAGVVEAFSGARLVLEDNANAYMNFLTPSTTERGLLFGDEVSSIKGGIIFNNSAVNDGMQFRTGGNITRIAVDSGGNVGIGTVGHSIDGRLHVQADDARVAKFDRYISDGQLVAWARDDSVSGDVTVSAGIVSYNAFTGSHYAWCDEEPLPGTLMTLTGINRPLHTDEPGEVVYGVKPCTTANDAACLGAYLSTTSLEDASNERDVRLIAAVGNGDLWVVDTGADIQPGDLLIASDIAGCAMLDDPVRFTFGNVIARAAEQVAWNDVQNDPSEVRRKKISVLFGPFTRGASAERLATMEARLSRLETLLEAQSTGEEP